MNFTSLDFLLFLPATLLLCRLFPARFRWPLLLAASYFFYMRYTPWVGLLLFGATFVSWFCAGKIAVAHEGDSITRTAKMTAHENDATCESRHANMRTITSKHSRPGKRFWLTLGIATPLACLFIFKYMGFLGQIIESVFGLFFGKPMDSLWGKSAGFSWDILLPAGISFYTFQTLSYVIDVYRKNLKHETHFGYYALYVSFFPQLVAGPIERPGNLLPQLKRENAFYPENLLPGFCQMLIGFFKKLVVADYLARFVDVAFASPKLVQGPGVALAACLFAIQIYCDFSGYCDIAAGVAGMLGIRLMKNFDRPYSAGSIREFWHRWHVSLTSWFTDYIYIPLGGSRKGIWRQTCNVLIVFFISGLWHGAAWHYVLWGCIHGMYLTAGILYRKFITRHVTCTTAGSRRTNGDAAGSRQTNNRDKRTSTPHQDDKHDKHAPFCYGGNVPIQFAHKLWTLTLVCFAWIFFRAQTVSDAFAMVSHLGNGWNANGIAATVNLLQITPLDVGQIALILLVLELLKKFGKIMEHETTHDEGHGTGHGATRDAQNSSHQTNSSPLQAAIIFYLILTICTAWLTLLSQNAAGTFIYFQF